MGIDTRADSVIGLAPGSRDGEGERVVMRIVNVGMLVRTRFALAAMVMASVLAFAGEARAQATSAGVLTVTATIESSISLTFETDAAGVSLAGAGTSTATLAYGTVSAFGTIATANVSRTVGASDFTVSSPFGVKVVKANSSSANYTLQAALGSADATNTWTIDSTDLTTSNQTLGASYSYGSAVAHTMKLTVPFTASAGAVSKTVNFTATSN